MDLFKIEYGLHQEIGRFIDAKDVEGKLILDVGCASGRIDQVLVERGAKKVFGIDISEDAISKATAKKIKHSSYMVASALEIPFSDNTFDTVVSFEVLEHIPKGTEGKMFSEIYRVLRPGGKLYLTTPNDAPVTVLLDPAWWLVRHRHYSQKHVVLYATTAGFTGLNIYVKGGIYTSLLLVVMYLAKWITRKEPPGYKYLLAKSREEYKLKQGSLSLFLEGRKSKQHA